MNDNDNFESYYDNGVAKNKKGKKKKIIIIMSIILVLILGALAYFFLFNNKEDAPIIKKKKKVEEKKLQIVDEDSNKRPIAIMIDNNVGNNAHVGLDKAYITYECIVEGGLTRIMAVFKDRDVDLIGPVRSSRHYYLDYAFDSDAIYAHFGWSKFAENDIKSLGVNNINGLYDSAPYWRDKSIAAPHNVFTSIDKLYDTAEKKGYDKETDDWKLLNYTTDVVDLHKPISTEKVKDPETGKMKTEKKYDPELLEANSVSVRYSPAQTRSYTYDKESKRYLRSMNNAEHVDRESKKTLSYKNILIIFVSNSTMDADGHQDLETVGNGGGYYITNGYALPINWSKESRKSKSVYTYANGKKVKFNDGNTIIQVAPTAYKAEIS